jgi:hypothetical protein
MAKFTGGCLCGDVRYEVDADPAYSGFCHHCVDCQKAGGTGHSAIAAFPRDAVRVTKGATTKYESAGGSGGPVTREFCARCGSRLFSGSTTAGPLMMVSAGTLDDPNALNLAFHIFGKDRLAWDHIDPGHTVFDHLPPRP